MEKTVLLVDNDQEFVELNKKEFEGAGFKVIAVDNSQDALAKIHDMKPALVITEIMLENSDTGFSLCHSIKKDYPDLPIVIVSDVERKTGIAFEISSKAEKSWIKADELINKPINSASLMCRINKYFR